MRWQGEKLKALVAERGFTQEAFSRRVGVSRQAFSAWVRGKTPKGLHLLRICQNLGVPAETFFEGTLKKPLAQRANGVATTPGAFVREAAVTYAVPSARKARPAASGRPRRGVGAPAEIDPFLAMLDLADSTASSLTNEQIDEVICVMETRRTRSPIA